MELYTSTQNYAHDNSFTVLLTSAINISGMQY